MLLFPDNVTNDPVGHVCSLDCLHCRLLPVLHLLRTGIPGNTLVVQRGDHAPPPAIPGDSSDNLVELDLELCHRHDDTLADEPAGMEGVFSIYGV